MNKAYTKLLPKQSQSLPVSPQFLCQLSNISECLPIEKQDRVNTIIVHTSKSYSSVSSH
jgi:hypothetical protein